MAERKPSLLHLLGKSVTICIDRPMRSAHPKYPDTVYPIHYGYIPGLLGGDGEPQDAYLMGVTTPIDRMDGVVIGIIRRLNDREDKLVVAPHGMQFHQAEIAEAVHFQERYYRTRIIPLYHRSCGSIIYRREKDQIRYLLLFQRGSHTWSFPKGHMEPGECEEATALREVREEVRLTVKLIPGFRQEATYPVGAGTKTVVLFLSKAPQRPIQRSSEVIASRWVTADEAAQLLHPSYLTAVEAAESFIRNRYSAYDCTQDTNISHE